MSKANVRMKEGSTWDEGVDMPRFSPLTRSISADVAIIGGGITGITTAYLLSNTGLDVVLVEKDRLTRGATGATTAFLTQYIDTELSELISMFGVKKAQAIVASHAQAIDDIEGIIQTENIECEFMRCSNYIYATSAQEKERLAVEQQAAQMLGLHTKAVREGSFPFEYSGCVELPGQAKFHPLKYLAGLVDILQQRGVRIFEETEAHIDHEGSPTVVTAPDGEVVAQQVVVATYAPLGKKLFFKKAFYTSYIYEMTVPAGIISEGIYEDMHEPYHYFRVDQGGGRDRVIIGGEDHRSDLPVKSSKSFQALARYIETTFPSIPYTLVRRWEGSIVESVDGLAFIGSLEHFNIFYATGFSGNGMTYSMIAATSFMYLIQNQQNELLFLYDPTRIPTIRSLAFKGRDYTNELVGGAVKNTMQGSKE
ncbi:MAG: FAD-dependent oxidoreductase [Candidatus Andersenbacteria bacterium]